MLRTLLSITLLSCLLGAMFGLSVAYGFLSSNAWKLEFETKSYPELAKKALERTTNSSAKAHIEETVCRFGIMDVKSTGSHDFFIQNIGTQDLILTLDQTTCSCLGIDITPSRVPPGATALCRLKYTAEQATVGKFSQGGVIRTNDPNNREIILSVEGIFTNPVVLSPSGIHLSRITAGTTRTATIRLYGFEDEPLQLSAPTWTDREHFDFQWESAEFTESEKKSSFFSAAKSVIEGTITIKQGLPLGSFQEWFQVKTNYSSQTSVNFLVSGQIVSGNVAISGQGYNRSTGIANLGQTVMGGSLSREISIQFSGASAPSASISVREVEPAWIRVELSEPKDVGPLLRIFSLTVEVPEDAPTGNYGYGGDGQQAQVMLETNNESMPVLKIPLQFAVEK